MAGSRPPSGRCSRKGETTCCYARSEKSWIADPDGVIWEAFLTNGEATIYGDSPALGARCGERPAARQPAAAPAERTQSDAG